jgi:hypothetical protein
MAATLGTTLDAQLTAIAFALVLAHDAIALFPLLATVVMKRSIMIEKIARRSCHFYREYGVDPLERHCIDEVMTGGVETIDTHLRVHEALAAFFDATQTNRPYPVVRDGSVADRAV